MNSGGGNVSQEFIDEVHRVAGGDPAVRRIITGLRRPVRVAVVGRDGVGRGSVATALRLHGIAGAEREGSDVCALVIAETVKAEDLAIARSVGGPVLIVLTKADLAGAGADGPIAVSRGRAVAIARQTGVPAVPIVGLLAATGELEDDLVAALRHFVTDPPDLTSVDAFVDGPHAVDRDVRSRLLARLDRFGIAHAVLAIAGGCDPEHLAAHLRRVGNVDEVASAIDGVTAPVRYRRMRAAIVELHAIAAQLDDVVLADLLASDVTAMAMMSAAVDVVTSVGLSVDRGDTATAHLARAVRWRSYGRGPVTALHRQCSADIVRGSLRLWDDVRMPPT